MKPLERIENRTFGAGEIVQFDNRNFVGCTLSGCTVSYSGGPWRFENRIFEPTEITLTGAAALTVQFLQQTGHLDLLDKIAVHVETPN